MNTEHATALAVMLFLALLTWHLWKDRDDT